ncbi:hypothetical protein K435DRAFT_101959 [Dendrothele bispora CBS 962.96]|uniref:RRM domain-containing protein n=1 Tax=Dendrothele bispora (strain CBS 962.96) TaxID=1314807 RepID=A0A4S8M3E3_DENBC|nr:hypothetical protein K435DRAFT_101959 [Dendrothele bispora CBS 962.96]
MSNSASSTGAALSPTANEVTPTPTPAPVIVKAGSPPRSQNADTTPLAPLAPKTEDNGADFVSSTVNMSGSTPTLPSLPSATTTSSSLSTMDSSTTFHTASSSATSISTSGSVKESVGADSAPIAGSMAPSPVLVHGIPESGTINLEELTKSSISTLNPHAAEHIPTSSSTPAILSSLENAGGEMSTSASAPAVSESSSSDYKTPNVYINGLPPHFPEDQLFELAAPFGEVKSVRSFTRHVGEKRSGYGFVLFETVDSAEKCIQSLRRFRNLHPTFSRQAHKIPGLPYTQSGPTWQQDASVTGSGSGHRNAGSPDAYDPGSGHTFKSKMEKFHDPNSTNLYIEGLPLSIDETSLAALVSPHRIKSQRFFQTRLSNPPRIIAFVRLETRTGAEEVIERLHGRMVRGWNDPGSRISVRFADTSEQRELRRTERTVREDDTSSARLTIAQAALLNLRGREQLRSQNGYTAPVIGTTRTQNAAAPTANQVYHDFTSNAHDGVNGGYRGSAHDISNAAIALVNAKNVAAMSGRLSNQRPKGQLFDQGLGGVNADRRTVTPQMAALLDSLRGKGQPWTGVDDRYGVNGGDFDVSQNPLRHSYPLGDVDINLGYSTHAPQTRQVAGSGASQARSGYTPAEEYILQNHQMNQRRRQPQGQHQDGRDQADFNVGVRGYRTQASTLALPQPSHGSSAYYSGGSPLPAVLEDEFHAGQAITPQGISTSHRGQPSSSSRGVRDGELASQYTSHTSNAPSTQSSQVSNRNYNNSQAHVRSTTLPPSSTSTSSTSSSGNRHYQHNSMSVPKSRNLSSDILRTTSQHQHQQQQTSQTLPSKHRSTNSISSNIVTAKDLNNQSPRLGTNEFSSHRYDSNLTLNTDPDYKKGNGEAFNSSPHTVYSSNASSFRGGDVYDAQSSPPLVSPALTYSSRGSAATLSPSTPYVGSFPSSTGGTFGGHGVGVGVDEVSDR